MGTVPREVWHSTPASIESLTTHFQSFGEAVLSLADQIKGFRALVLPEELLALLEYHGSFKVKEDRKKPEEEGDVALAGWWRGHPVYLERGGSSTEGRLVTSATGPALGIIAVTDDSELEDVDVEDG